MKMETDPDLIDRIRRIIGGESRDGEIPDEPEMIKTKVDGRSKEFKQAVQRIGNGQKRKSGEGLDGRSKTYKDTLKRIQTKKEKLTTK